MLTLELNTGWFEKNETLDGMRCLAAACNMNVKVELKHVVMIACPDGGYGYGNKEKERPREKAG